MNEAANIHYMTGGQTRVPVVFHVNHGIRGGGAAQHSHSPQAMLWNTPGLEIMHAVERRRDVQGLIRTAVAAENPVIWVDHVRLFDLVGDGARGAVRDPVRRGATSSAPAPTSRSSRRR